MPRSSLKRSASGLFGGDSQHSQVSSQQAQTPAKRPRRSASLPAPRRDDVLFVDNDGCADTQDTTPALVLQPLDALLAQECGDPPYSSPAKLPRRTLQARHTIADPSDAQRELQATVWWRCDICTDLCLHPLGFIPQTCACCPAEAKDINLWVW